MFIRPGCFLTAPGPGDGPWRPKTPKSRPLHFFASPGSEGQPSKNPPKTTRRIPSGRGIRNRPARRCPMEVSYPGRSLGPTGRFLKGTWWLYLGPLGPWRNLTSPKNLPLDFLKLNFLSPALAVAAARVPGSCLGPGRGPGSCPRARRAEAGGSGRSGSCQGATKTLCTRGPCPRVALPGLLLGRSTRCAPRRGPRACSTAHRRRHPHGVRIAASTDAGETGA